MPNGQRVVENFDSYHSTLHKFWEGRITNGWRLLKLSTEEFACPCGRNDPYMSREFHLYFMLFLCALEHSNNKTQMTYCFSTLILIRFQVVLWCHYCSVFSVQLKNSIFVTFDTSRICEHSSLHFVILWIFIQ